MLHYRFGFLNVRCCKRCLGGIAMGGIAASAIALFWILPVFRSPSLKHGFVLKTDVDAQGKSFNYMVFVPYDYHPGEQYPLLLFLNGHGENGTDGVTAISKNFGPPVWEMKRGFPFVCAIPQCRPGQAWTDTEGEHAMAVLERVAKDYGTDPDRVYITGVSAGGTGAWSLVKRYPGRFAAAVPFCGTPDGDAEAVVGQHLPIWNFYNAGDAVELVEANRTLRQKLFDAGGSPIVTEYPQEGHNCWERGYRCVGMYTWLLEQSRSNNARQRQPFHLFSTDELLARWQTQGPVTWSADDKQILSCKNTSAGTAGCLVSDVAHEAGEIHLEFFLDPGQPNCQLKLLTSAASRVEDAYTVQVQSAEAGSGGLQDSQGRSLAILDPAAQRQLQADSWNELRLAFSRQRILLHLNGWKAFDVGVALPADTTFRIAIVAPEHSARTCWRLVRLRGEKGEMP